MFITEFSKLTVTPKRFRPSRVLPNELQYMLSPVTYKEDEKPFVPFFWHVPKAAGSYVRKVCSEGYSLKPQADLGQPEKVDMLARRMHGQSKTLSDISEAKKQCKKFVISSILNLKFFKSCVLKLSLSKPEHTCLPKCLGFIQTPLLYEASKVFMKTPKKARVATLLRDPVERFISLYTYLKTATWEPTYNPTNLTLNEYILTGEYKKSSDNGNWMVCTLSQCGKSKNIPTTEEDLNIAKQVMSNMLVGFTNNVQEFFDRLEPYWHIPKYLRQRARHGAMKEKINVQKINSKKPKLSYQAASVLHRSLSHDIKLYNFAKDVLWKEQLHLFKTS